MKFLNITATALAIATAGATSYLYAAMNGYGGDGGDYQGHVTTIDLASGVKSNTVTAGVAAFTTNSGQTASSVSGGGAVTLNSSTGADLSVTGAADFLKSIGLTTATGGGATTVGATRTTSSSTVGRLITDGSTLNVNGKIITFKNAATPTASASHTGITGNVETDGTGNSTVYLQAGTIADVLKAIDLATGVETTANASGTATLSTASGQTASSASRMRPSSSDSSSLSGRFSSMRATLLSCDGRKARSRVSSA